MQPTTEDYQRLADPEFIAERRRVREQLERIPEHSAERSEMAALYERMTTEFDRRARSAWAQADCAQG